MPAMAPCMLVRLSKMPSMIAGKNDAAAPERFEPLDEASTQLVLNQLRAREGTPYRQETISADISRLKPRE